MRTLIPPNKVHPLVEKTGPAKDYPNDYVTVVIDDRGSNISTHGEIMVVFPSGTTHDELVEFVFSRLTIKETE